MREEDSVSWPGERASGVIYQEKEAVWNCLCKKKSSICKYLWIILDSKPSDLTLGENKQSEQRHFDDDDLLYTYDDDDIFYCVRTRRRRMVA